MSCKAGSELRFKEQSWHLAAVLVKAHLLTCLSLRDSICEMGIMMPVSSKCMNAQGVFRRKPDPLQELCT